MKLWKEITPAEFAACPFSLYNSDWALVTAQAGEKTNTMTISWGGLGTLCNRPVATIYIRNIRYTYGILEAADRFSISILPEEHRGTLNYLGAASGRDEDKIAKSGLTLIREGGTPAFAEARLILVCRKFYGQTMDKGCFTDPAVPQKTYGDTGTIHKMFIGEVEKILVAEDAEG